MRAFIALGVIMLLGGVQVARAEVVWRGDFETGDISQWTKPQEVAPDRLQVVDSPARQGKHALRVEVRQGDDPISASGNRAELVWSPLEKEGNDRYYAWSTMWPADYPSDNTWQVFTQWHHTGNTGSPPLSMYVTGETMYLHVEASQATVWTHPLERGKWHDFILHAKWSSDPAVGFLELWYDGELVLRKTMGANMYPGQDNILKQGLYRNDTISKVGVLYHDGMTVATTLEDVLPPPTVAPTPTPAPAPATPPTGTPTGGTTGDAPSQPDPGNATGTGGVAATDGSGAPAASSGGCSVASASGSRGFGGAGGFALALFGLALALRRTLRRKRVRAR